jgi:hypothetical protein
LTTSFHPATGNPIMTSTTYNHSVAHATDESKTVQYKESHGEIQGLSKGRKGWGIRVLMVLNDLLPVSIRPIKSKRAHRRRYLGVRHRLFMYRMHWRSHNKKKVKDFLRIK